MFSISLIQWLAASLGAFIFGLSKTGLPGLGILGVPLMASVIPARASTGVVLPMLIFADIIAVIYYRRRAVWPHLVRLIPWAASGIVLGYFIMGRISDSQLRPTIGIIVLVMLGLGFWRDRRAEKGDLPIPDKWWFAAIMGMTAGITTMLANAAGPIMIMYLLAMRLPKMEFVGTSAWYFFLMNWFKVPFSVSLDLITRESIRFNILLLPVTLLGAFIGIRVLKAIPEKSFTLMAQILATAATLNLIFF